MKNMVAVLLSVLFMFIASLVCYAEETGLDNFEKFLSHYYLNPEPQRLPTILESLFKSETFSDEQAFNEHNRNIISYFFARATGSEQNLIERYKSLFENGTRKQRIFLLKILQFCGDEKVKIFLQSKLKEEAFAGEKEQIRQVLKEGIPVKFNPISEPINEAGDLDFLWVEFMATGNDEAINRIISVLHWLEDGKGMEIAIGGAARWSLASNCREHKKVLETCKGEWPKLRWPSQKILRKIVAEIDDSAIADYLADRKMIKIVTRNRTPGIEEGSFASLPITAYMFGDNYARIEEKPDPAMQLHGLIIVNQRDVWMINLWNKTARHIVDPDLDGTFHAPIMPDERGRKKIREFEFGRELDFMKDNDAQISQIKIDQKVYDLYSLEIEGVKIELILEKVKQVPHAARVFEGEKIIHAISYDEYEPNLTPDLKLFDPPENIRIFEASKEDSHPTQIDRESLEKRVAYTEKLNTPDLMQTDPDGRLPAGGKKYCAPVALSNSFMWLAENGFENLAPKLRDRKTAQLEIARILGTKEYMNSADDGTGMFGLLRGVTKYVKSKGYQHRYFKYQGWRKVPRELNCNVVVPKLNWIKGGLIGSSAVWFNVGWYKYNASIDEYNRVGGHWVTLVGYGIDQQGNNSPDILIIHDPASRAGKEFSHEFVRIKLIRSGKLTGGKKGLPRSAKGYYILGGGMHVKKSADLVILDGVIVLKMNRPN